MNNFKSVLKRGKKVKQILFLILTQKEDYSQCRFLFYTPVLRNTPTPNLH